MSGENTDNLYVTGLPLGTNEDRVKQIFGQYGTVTSVRVLPPNAGKGDVACMVRMGDADQAKWLIDNVSGNIPQGLAGPINIKPANPMGSWGGKGGMGGMGDWGGMGGGKGGWGGPMGGYPMMPPWMIMQMMKGGKGKGWGKSGGGLISFPAERKIWVGNLPESVTYEELKAHFTSPPTCTAKFAAVLRGKAAGSGGVAFGTAEEATAAIAALNGSSLGGATIEVDVWTKKERPAPAEAAAEA